MEQHEIDLLVRIEELGGPGMNRGSIIDFYPSDEFLSELTRKYNLEFASVFTMGINSHYLWVGTRTSIPLPIMSDNNFEILIKHTHPGGTEAPSIHDINWLKDAIKLNSPQVKSLILPLDKNRLSFNINTPFLE